MGDLLAKPSISRAAFQFFGYCGRRSIPVKSCTRERLRRSTTVAGVIDEHGLSVCAINLLPIRTYGGDSLRHVKTDKADAKKIARCAPT